MQDDGLSYGDEFPGLKPFAWNGDTQIPGGLVRPSEQPDGDAALSCPAASFPCPVAALAGPAVDGGDLLVSASSGAAADPLAMIDMLSAARLDGARLAAREIAHLINNDLAVSVGALDLLRHRGDLPPVIFDLVERALAGVNAATVHVERLQRIQRIVTHQTPAGPSLDLDRSG